MKRLPGPDILVAIGFFFAALAFLWEVTIGGKVLLPLDNLYAFPPFKALVDGQFVPYNLLISDMVLQNVSWKNLARDAILNGALPLWNPYILSGVPFLAAGQPGALYPFGVVFYLLKPEYAYGWFTAFQLFLGGLFMYCYLRVIKVERFGAMFAGFAFMFTSFLVVSFLWPMVVSTAIWTPLLLAAIESTVASEERGKGPQLLWPLVGAIGVGLQFLAGHMEISFYVLFTMLYYATWRLAMMLLKTRNVYLTLRASATLLVMVALGAGLAAVQLLPFQEVIKENFRAGFVTYRDVIGWALPKIQVLSFVMPDFFGNPTHHSYFDIFEMKTKLVGNNFLGKPTDPPSTIFWGTKNYVEAASYLGILPLVLATAAVLFRRNKYTLIFLSYVVFSLLLAFGSPLYAIFFYGIPGFDQLHTPFRWIYPYSVSVLILSGIGAGHMLSPKGSEAVTEIAKRFRRPFALLTITIGLLIVATLALSLIFRERTLALATSILIRSTKLQSAFSGPEMLVSYEFRNLLILGILLVACGTILWMAAKATNSLKIWQSLAIAVLLADLFYFGTVFNTKSNSDQIDVIPPSIQFLKKDSSIYRVATFGTDDILKPDIGMRYGLQDIRGYDTIILKQYVEFWRLMEEPHGLLYSMIKTLDNPSSLSSKWLNLLNVKYILSSQPMNNDNLELVYNDDIFVYHNVNHLPRAYLVHKIRRAATPEQALSELRDAAFDPRREAVIQEWPEDNADLRLTGEDSVQTPKIVAYETNKVIIDVQSDVDAVLVLSDTFFPGWRATIDEREATVYKANYHFRAIPLPAGSHTVTFKYSPLSVTIGLLGSFISGLVIVLGLVVVIASRRYRRTSDQTIQRVAKNSFAPMATSLVNKAIDTAFTMLLLRVLDPENVGKYAFAIVVYTYFEIFTNFGLTTLVQREVAKDRAQSDRYLSNSLLARLVLIILAAPAVAAFLYLWRALFGLDQVTTLAIILLTVGLVPGNIAAALSSLFLAQEKMEYPALVSVATTLLKVTFGAAVLLLGWGIVGLAGVSVAVNCVTAVIFSVLVTKVLLRPKIIVDRKLTRVMLTTSWPLMINILLATMFFRVDFPILQSMRGDRELGYYSTAYKFIDGLNIIPSNFTIALFPVLSRYADSAKDTFMHAYALALRLLLLISIPIAVGTVFLAEPIILLFGGPKYVPHSVLALQVLIWFLPFSYVNSLTQYVLIAINQQRFITLSFIVATTFNIAANIVMIPRFGFVGAGIVTILSEVVLLLPFLYAVFHHLGPLPLFSLAVRPVVASAAMGVALWKIQGSEAPLSFLVGTIVYIAALVALGTFNSDDARIARKLMGREQIS